MEQILKNLQYCSVGMECEVRMTKSLQSSYFKTNPCLFTVEEGLLSLAASDTADGIFFVCVLKIEADSKTYNVARIFEHGAFEGYYRNVAEKKIKAELNLTELLPYVSFIDEDVKQEQERNVDVFAKRIKGTAKSKKYYAYQRILIDNKNSINNNLKDLLTSLEGYDDIQCLATVALCMQKKQSWDSGSTEVSSERYFICHPEAWKEDWSSSFLLYRSNPIPTANQHMFYDDLSNDLSLEEQFLVISSLPNHHKWKWENSVKKLRFEQKLSACCRYSPGSPRNRIINATCYRDDCYTIIRSIIQKIFGLNVEVNFLKRKFTRDIKMKNCVGIFAEPGEEPYNKKINEDYGSNDESVAFDELVPGEELEEEANTLDVIDDPFIDELDSVVNSSTNKKENDIDEVQISTDGVESDTTIAPRLVTKILEPHAFNAPTLYGYFRGEMFRRGTFMWRVLDQEKQVLLMNDFDGRSGNFNEKLYVHTTAHYLNEKVVLECTCDIFKTNRAQSNDLQPSKLSCCHCKLFKEIFPLSFDHCNMMNLSPHVNVGKVNDGFSFAAESVIPLPSKEGTKLYSVSTDGKTEFVTLSKVSNTAREIVRCDSNICKSLCAATRSVQSLKDEDAGCCHLKAFRKYYVSEMEEDNDSDIPCEVTDELLPQIKWEEIFDPESGLWCFGKDAPSKIKVDSNSRSPKLGQTIRQRHSMDSETLHEFIPDIPPENCECNAGWTSLDNPEGIINFDCKTTLYTQHSQVFCKVFLRECIEGKCVLRWDGSADCVYRSSQYTCAGYELGWRFVDDVMNGKMTFRGFVSSLSSSYLRYNPEKSEPFMSVATFISWFFGWASHMQLDFRESCKLCDGPSKIVACDGTMIGTCFKSTFVRAIETPTKVAPIDEKSRRFDRCFIRNPPHADRLLRKIFTENREKLRTLCYCVIKEDTKIDKQTIEDYLPNESLDAFREMIDVRTDVNVRKAYARVLTLLSRDSSLDAVIPYRISRDCSLFCQKFGMGDIERSDLSSFVYNMSFYCSEFSELLAVHPHSPVIKLLGYCADRVTLLHGNDVTADHPIPISGTYNPPRFGRAYYFNDHGCQVREMRQFSIDKERRLKKNNNFDDAPGTICEKKFPEVSKRGISYLFLWFCPKHGHCLGFHVIPGSEGRKDPAASLYTHCDKAPEEIMYDYACSLSEYTHNRESGYFQETRFFHDVFHGYSHKCSKAFRANRLNGFGSVNSSICEQFNSFIQNIKTSARLMSQPHFCFYLQFFIRIWNEKKRNSFEKHLNIARQCDEK